MKPITHPLAIAYCEAMASGSRTGRAYNEWAAAGRPLYVAPTPLPAPALGMRVWYTRPASDGDYRALVSLDITNTSFCGCPWKDIVGGYRVADITHITDFRTGEVLWRRQ